MKVDVDFVERDRQMSLAQQRGEVSPNEMREYMKKKGVVPGDPVREFPVYMACTSGIFDAYLPPESDAKASILSLEVSP